MDKLYHFFAGSIISLIFLLWFGPKRIWWSLVFVLFFGASKEILDLFGFGEADLKDFSSTLIGGIYICIIVYLR